MIIHVLFWAVATALSLWHGEWAVAALCAIPLTALVWLASQEP